jgi:hypothetical protein
VYQACAQVHILDPECHALSHPQPRPIEQVCDQSSYALHLSQDGGHLIHAQYDRQAIPALDPLESTQVTNVHLKDIPVEEQQRVEGLRLSGSRHRPHAGQVVDEGDDARWPHDTWMLAAMEMDVPANPEPVCLLGSVT